MLKKSFRYGTYHELDLNVTFYSAGPSTESKATLLYFHGGGLLYGDREDLPETYCNLLVSHGYAILAVDYPLAPEVKLPTIYACLKKAIDWFLSNAATCLGLKNQNYFLFGRSAGGYLAYLLSARYPTASQKGLICFYAYYDLTMDPFNQPSSYYGKFQKIAPLDAQAMILSQPHTSLSINQRFSLYLSGRQFGNWLSYLFNSVKEKDIFSLSQIELAHLPPLFLTHSTTDQDIPVEVSRKIHAAIPSSYYIEVENLTHDFDTETTQTKGLQVYQELIRWMDGVSIT